MNVVFCFAASHTFGQPVCEKVPWRNRHTKTSILSCVTHTRLCYLQLLLFIVLYLEFKSLILVVISHVHPPSTWSASCVADQCLARLAHT